MENKKDIMGRSLLAKSLRQFAGCTAVCFALSAPLFYLLTKYFYAEDMIDIVEAVNRGENIPPLDLERDIVAGMMLQFLLIFLAISLAWFITMRFATKELWRPFDDSLQKAERFNLARNEVPVFKDTDVREFNRLNQSLERLMKKDKETYRIQKEFTENASHELQTPLAIIRGKIDLLMQEDLNERQLRLASDLDSLTMRMGHLNRGLLLLAKIDNEQFAAMEEVDTFRLLEDSLPLYETVQGTVRLHPEDCRLTPGEKLRADRTLLECLLKNLIVNAIRHSAPHTVTRIRVEDSRITVSNPSSEGKALDAATLFRRFRRGDGNRKGNGLGLAIVKAICDFHHWQTEYRFESGCHNFIVNFYPAE